MCLKLSLASFSGSAIGEINIGERGDSKLILT